MGKTTLIEALKARDYVCFDELARLVIKKELARNPKTPNVPWTNLGKFQDLVFEQCLALETVEGVAFYDRGIPDSFAYLEQGGLEIPPHYIEATQTYGYEKEVFITPPWPAIYQMDEERKETFEQATALYNRLREIYLKLGFDVIELPLGSINERIAFIESRLELA